MLLCQFWQSIIAATEVQGYDDLHRTPLDFRAKG